MDCYWKMTLLKYAKHCGRQLNPVLLTLLQEKLLLGLQFWIAGHQCLQLSIELTDVTLILIFSQANIHTHVIEDEA